MGCLLFLVFTSCVFSQTQNKKIGLVLSGGGAKGLAHIGVLKEIEKAGIKLDYIAGTSMGAIVGGLYASGYTATQLDSIFKTVNIDALMQDYSPRENKPFYEKQNDELYAISLPFKKFKLGLPAGLSKGLYNYNLFNRLLYSQRFVRDFSKLPIPFVCIATNAETGEEVRMENGVLVDAIFVSGALPTLYSPVTINNKMLIDGGVVNNYPVDVLTEKGMDYIIGVDVQDALKSKDQLTDVTAVLLQISNFNTQKALKSKIEKTNLYIKPDISNFNVIDFEKSVEIIKKGEEAAKKYSLELEELGIMHKKPKMQTQKDSLYIGNISVNNLDQFTRAYVLGKLQFKPNKKIAFNTFEKGIRNINATQNFQSILYNYNENDSLNTLQLNLRENKNNTFLKLGLHYDELFKSSLLVNFTQKKILTKNDVFSLDVVFGDNFRYMANYYIDNGFYWSVGFRSTFTRFNTNVAITSTNQMLVGEPNIYSINVDYKDWAHQFYLQTILLEKAAFGMGAELKHLNISTNTLQNTQPVLDNSDYFNVYGYVNVDTQDQKYFPKKGLLFNAEWKSYLYSSDFSNSFKPFSIIKGNLKTTKKILPQITLQLNAEAGAQIAKNSVNFFDFSLGGYGNTPVNNFRPFFGYNFISITTDSYLQAGFVLDYEFIKKNHLNFTANFANAENNMFQTTNWFSKPTYNGYAFGYGIESILGPLEIKHSWSPELGQHFTWLAIGYAF